MDPGAGTGLGGAEPVAAPIDRSGLLDLLAAGAQLVEVLPADEYRADHLPGAMNIPLRELARRARAELDPSRPVVVYCHDAL